MAGRKDNLRRMARLRILTAIGILTAIAATAIAAGARAQLLGPVGDSIGAVGRLPGDVVGDVAGAPLDRVVDGATRLAQERVARLTDLARRNPQAIELDAEGQPAVRGEIVAVDPDVQVMREAAAAGFETLSDERIEGLDVRSVRLRPPQGWSLREALKRLRKIAPDGDFTANHLHLPSGATAIAAGGMLAAAGAATNPLGLIDGGVAGHPALTGPIEQRGFAAGAPAPNPHGTAVASLIAGSGPVRGGAPGSALLVADVYGRDPAGGNAVAIARALGWMVQRRVPVVTVSLVGPANPLLTKAVAASQARGTMIVAAVGNDGPAAPPAYPASYPGVIAVTGVDGRNRALPEAGRALHLDYAAPGTDMVAAKIGGVGKVRGTSFAAPLVAGRLGLVYAAPDPARRAAAITTLDRQARDLGKKGPDRQFGRGLVCGDCRTAGR